MLKLEHPDDTTANLTSCACAATNRTCVSGSWIQNSAEDCYWLILLRLFFELDATSSCVAGPGQTSSLDWGCELHSGVPQEDLQTKSMLSLKLLLHGKASTQSLIAIVCRSPCSVTHSLSQSTHLLLQCFCKICLPTHQNQERLHLGKCIHVSLHCIAPALTLMRENAQVQSFQVWLIDGCTALAVTFYQPHYNQFRILGACRCVVSKTKCNEVGERSQLAL